MGFREWATKKVSRVVQDAVVEPVKKDVIVAKDQASEKIGLITNIIRFLVCFGIGAIMLKDGSDQGYSAPAEKHTEPTTIVINNHIYEGGQRHDYRKPGPTKKS